MRNYKKAIMLLLALVVLFAAGVVVSADTTSTLTDDFDVYTELVSFKKSYPSGSYTSDVLRTKMTSKGEPAWGYFQLVPGEGTDGTTALRLNATSYDDHTYMLSKYFDSSTGDTIVYTFDMRIDKHHGYNVGGESNAVGKKTSLFSYLFEMLTDGNTINPVGTADNGEDFEYEIGKWYNVVMIRDVGSLSAYIIDKENGEICTYAKSNKAGVANDSITFAYVPAIVKRNTLDMYFDNFKETIYNPESQAPSVIETNIEDGESDVLLNKEIIVEFDQLFLDATPAPEVFLGETEVDATVEKVSLSAVKITFDEMLERETEYKISFEDVVNDSMVACNSDDITFTTEGLHLWNDVEIAPIEADIVTSIEFTIGEEFGYTEFTGKLLVAVYDEGVMTNLVPITLVNQDVSEAIHRDVALGMLESGNEVKIMLIDDVDGIVPLALGSTIVE